jgi:ketosteroid isomerase-like protein
MATSADGPAGPLDLVERLVKGIETGDLDSVRAVYAPGAVVWTCFDDRTRDVDASMGVLEWLVGATTERHYDVARRVEFEGGVLQQHVLRATARNGKTFAMPACLVIRIDGDHITRIDEYLDPHPVTAAIG